MDTRAQSIGISRFFLALIVGAIVTWLVWLVTDPILSRASSTTNNSTANQATQWITSGTEWLPVAFLLISVFGLLVYAIFSREVLG